MTTLLACFDCTNARENGAEDYPQAWRLLPDDDVTSGLDYSRHDCESPGLVDCDCEIIEFSVSDCDACGTTLAGARWYYTLWEA